MNFKTAVAASVIGIILGTVIYYFCAPLIHAYTVPIISFVLTLVEQVKQNPTVAALFALFGTGITSVTMNALYKKAVTKTEETTNYLLGEKEQSLMLAQSEIENLAKQKDGLQTQVDQLISSQKTVAEVKQTFQNTITDLNNKLQDKEHELAKTQSELRSIQPMFNKFITEMKEDAQRVK